MVRFAWDEIELFPFSKKLVGRNVRTIFFIYYDMINYRLLPILFRKFALDSFDIQQALSG